MGQLAAIDGALKQAKRPKLNLELVSHIGELHKKLISLEWGPRMNKQWACKNESVGKGVQ